MGVMVDRCSNLGKGRKKTLEEIAIPAQIMHSNIASVLP